MDRCHQGYSAPARQQADDRDSPKVHIIIKRLVVGLGKVGICVVLQRVLQRYIMSRLHNIKGKGDKAENIKPIYLKLLNMENRKLIS